MKFKKQKAYGVLSNTKPPKNQPKTEQEIESNAKENAVSNPRRPTPLTNWKGEKTKPLKDGFESEYRYLNNQLSKLTKRELEKLRKIVNKTINKKYPNKKKRYDVPVEERVMAPKQLNLFLSNVHLPVYKMYFLTMSATGMRPSEALVLKLEQLDKKERCFWVWVSKKVNPVRVPKYFPRFYYKKLGGYVELFSDKIVKSGFLFPNRFNTGHICLRQAGDVFRKTLDKIGLGQYYTLADDKKNPLFKESRKLRYFTMNSLRKCFASYQGSLEQARMVLHHSSSRVTEKHYYATLKERKKELIVQAFSDF